MSRATDALFDELHGLLAQSMIDELREAREKNEAVKPATMSAIIKFLKDNGIDAPATDTNPLGVLSREVPEFTDLDGKSLQ